MTSTEILITALIALCIFLSVALIKVLHRVDGAIIVNKNDPMKDTYRLELHIPFGELDNRKTVVFKIHQE